MPKRSNVHSNIHSDLTTNDDCFFVFEIRTLDNCWFFIIIECIFCDRDENKFNVYDISIHWILTGYLLFRNAFLAFFGNQRFARFSYSIHFLLTREEVMLIGCRSNFRIRTHIFVDLTSRICGGLFFLFQSRTNYFKNTTQLNRCESQTKVFGKH